MSKENPNNRERYIMLYPEDFEYLPTWGDICEIAGVSSSCVGIRINFDYDDVIETEGDDEDDDDEYDEDEYDEDDEEED